MDITDKFKSLHKALMNIAHNPGHIHCIKDTKLKNILTLAAQKLKVARVSVWKLSLSGDSIACELLYDHEKKSFERNHILHKHDYPNYFAAATQKKLIDASDARQDPRTCEFTESYLKPLSIYSMLDAPIFLSGEFYGVLCIEQTHKIKHWDIAEMSFAASIADTISLLNEQESWIKAREQIDFLAQTDSLTGLNNRHHFHQQLEREKAFPLDPDSFRALIIFGVDFFKTINDSFGPRAADQALGTLATRFSRVMKNVECRMSRLEGDTFGFWLPQLSSQQQLTDLISKLQSSAKEPISISHSSDIELTGSIGAFIDSEGCISYDPIRCAEIAMQKAKEQQRGSCEYFTNDFLKELRSAKALDKEIVIAFEEEQFVPHYQPIVETASGKIIGIEALVRWQHPEKGLIPPFKFLPSIAKLGLMPRLGSFMLRKSCADIKQLQSINGAPKWVSVNLSADQLYNHSLTEEIKGLLIEFELDSQALALEIVEELISQDSDLVRSQLDALHDLGIGLSIDDFGTGYSSLSRLKHLPVSKLKIDKSFVDGLPDTYDDTCIAQSIIGLAKAMKIELVAEGVETKEQEIWLKINQCDYLQGYLFSKPVALETLIEFIKSNHSEIE